MKTYSIITILIAAFAFGSCNSAYRSAQTPDAVYYSPKQSNENARSASSQETEVVQGDNPDAGNYVVYDDGSNNGSYASDYDGYYSQRISMFDRPGSLYAFNSYRMYPYMGLGYGSFMNYSAGWPSFSLGLNWGLPLGHWYSPYSYGMMYSPFSYGMMYSPYSYGMMYGPGYAFGGYPYYSGYRYGGYYGGGYGKYVSPNPRPASSWGPRRSVSSGAIRGASTTQSESGAPRRVFNSQNNSGNIDRNSGNSPRRVFQAKPGEHPVNVNSNRTVETEKPRVRIFRRSTETNTSTPTRTTRPTEIQRQPETRTFQQPTRTFEQPSRSYESAPSAPTRSSSPSRSFSPRGR